MKKIAGYAPDAIAFAATTAAAVGGTFGEIIGLSGAEGSRTVAILAGMEIIPRAWWAARTVPRPPWLQRIIPGGPEAAPVARAGFELVRDYFQGLRGDVAGEAVRTRNILDGRTDNGQVQLHPKLTMVERSDLIFATDYGIVDFEGTQGQIPMKPGVMGNIFKKDDSRDLLRQRISPAMVQAGRRLEAANSAFRQRMHDLLVATVPGQNVSAQWGQQIQVVAEDPAFIESYVTHLHKGWDKLNDAERGAVGKAFRLNNPLDLKRKYPSFEVAYAASGGKLTPKYKTIEGLADAHRRFHAEAVRGRIFMHHLEQFEGYVGMRLVSATKKPGWVPAEHWFFRFYRELPYTAGDRVYVHPSLAKYTSSMLGREFEGKFGMFLNVLRKMNQVVKRGVTALVQFHSVAMGLSALGLPTGIKGALGPFTGHITSAEGIAEGMLEADVFLNDPAWVEVAVGDGLLIQIPESMQVNLWDAMDEAYHLGKHEGKPVKAAAAGVARVVTSPIRLGDWWTWDVMHRRLKVVAYEVWKQELARAGTPPEEVGRVAATMANATMGALDWDNLGTLMRHPKVRQAVNAVMLWAYDWTGSVVHQDFGPFMPSVGGGPPPPDRWQPPWSKGPKRTGQAREEWEHAQSNRRTSQAKLLVRATAGLVAAAAIIHYANKKRDTGKGEFPWEDPENIRRYQETGMLSELYGRIYIGKGEDGVGRYWYVEKQLREGEAWLRRPFGQAYQKMARPTKTAIEFISGKQFAGYKNGRAQFFPVNPDPSGQGRPFDLGHVIEQNKPFILRREHQREGAVPHVSPSFGLFSEARGISIGAARHTMKEIVDEYVDGGNRERLYARWNTIGDAMLQAGHEVKMKGEWRSDVFFMEALRQAKTERQRAYWKAVARGGPQKAQEMVPALERLATTREDIANNLYAKLKPGRLKIKGRFVEFLEDVWSGKDGTAWLYQQKVSYAAFRAALAAVPPASIELERRRRRQYLDQEACTPRR